MSRASFILDGIPKSCRACKLRYDSYGQVTVCITTDREIDEWFEDKKNPDAKPDWCPLVEMPKELVPSENNTDEERDYMEGWNSCLLEIEKRYELNMDLINENNE